MTTTIEPARSGDLAPILALLRRCELPTDDFERHLGTALVARREGQIVASAALEVYGACALLRSVAVDAAARGAGLGQRVTAAALDLARDRRVATVYLLTTTAGGYFPRFGFQPIERAAVHPAVQASVEFTSACPSSAMVMARDI